jgi:hypothetical protein
MYSCVSEVRQRRQAQKKTQKIRSQRDELKDGPIYAREGPVVLVWLKSTPRMLTFKMQSAKE